MNILFYNGTGVFRNGRGKSTMILLLLEILKRNGHQVYILSCRNNFPNYSYEDCQFFLPAEKIVDEKNLNFASFFLEQHKIDIVISTCNAEELSLIWKCKKNYSHFKIISWLHNMILTPLYNIAARKEYSLRQKHLTIVYNILKLKMVNKIIVWFYKKLNSKEFKTIIKYSDRVVLLNKTQAKEFCSMCGIKQSPKIAVIPNTTLFKRDSQGKKENLVLWVGSFETDCKRPDIMLKVWRKISHLHPEWHLSMLGRGPALDEMKALAKRWHLNNLSFEGRVETLPYYQRAKVFCCTSTHESFSLTLLEALSCKVVPISFNSFPTATELVVHNVNGMLIQDFDIDEYARSLSNIMFDSTLLYDLSQNREITLNNFSLDSFSSKWENLLGSIM